MKTIKLLCLVIFCSAVFTAPLFVVVELLPDPSDTEWVRESCSRATPARAPTRKRGLSRGAAKAIAAFVLSHPSTRDTGFGVKVLDAGGGMGFVIKAR